MSRDDDEIEYCERCGAKLSGRWESLSKGLATNLIKMYETIVTKQENSVHLQNEMSLTKNQYNNFQKLRYFGLIAHVENKPGKWLLTRNGALFVKNQKSIPKQVLVFRNLVREKDERLVLISEVMKSEPYWMKRDDFLYQPIQERLF